MGSKTRAIRKSKGLLAANGILFQMFKELHQLKEQVLSQHKRLELQDCYTARLERAFVDKAIFTNDEITAIAALAISDVKPTKEEVAAQPKTPVDSPSDDDPPCGPPSDDPLAAQPKEEQLELPNTR